VASGDHVSISASGTYGVAGSDPGKTPSGVGCSGSGLPGDKDQSLQAWTPIGRVGSQTPFCVGGQVSFVATASGDLQVILNDDVYGDNWGGFTVHWTITG